MTRFNTAAPTTKTVNLAGGTAFSKSPELEFVSAILTTFLNDKFYQKGTARQTQVIKLLDSIDPYFAAQAALYARNEFGMRSVTHVVAGELASRVKGEEWTKRFFDKAVHRPDDMTEILSYYYATKAKNEPAALRKGFAAAFQRFDAYQLAKYRGVGKGVKLVDVVNVVHPKQTDAILALVKDELRNTDTWEAKVSAAGQTGKEDAKKEAWTDLVNSGKIAQFALLRNLRNILQEAPEVVDKACALLVQENRIRKSLILPFRYATAIQEVEKISGVNPSAVRKVISALSDALDKSCANVPTFDGDTLVAIDTSGSMTGMGWGSRVDETSPIAHAALFGAVLAKKSNADIMLWDTDSTYMHFNPSDSTLSLSQTIIRKANGGGTNMSIVFQEANRKYDRIVILTDEESWAHNYGASPTQALASYRTRCGADPFVYNWDLAGHGTLQFPERNVATLAGWSEKVFDIMKLVETDKQALVNEIKKIEI